MKGVLIKIRQGLDSFSPAEQKIGRYILKNPEQILNLTITQLAQKSQTSEASIVRFCKTLGLKGYQELKITIPVDIHKPKLERKIIYEQIEKDESIHNILQKVSLGNYMAIQDTLKVLDINQLQEAIELINKCKRIFIFGVGASSIVGLDAQYKFMRINIPTFMYFDPHIQLTSAANIDKDDAVIGISNSGRTSDVIQTLRLARKNGAKTIVITQYGDSPILDVADIKLFTASVENNFRSAAMASRIAQLNIIDCLYIGIACRRYDEVIELLSKTRKVLEDKKIN
jgi:DNA-binding MurR/RpiR family transcriptional regulator